MENMNYRLYLSALQRTWVWYSLAGLIAATIAFLALQQEPVYVAAATVSMDYRRYSTITPPTSVDFQMMAQDSSVVHDVYQQWNPVGSKPSIDIMVTSLNIDTAADGYSAKLTASANTAEDAIQLVNLWEEAILSSIHKNSETRLDDQKAAKAAIEAILNEVDQALIEFSSTNNETILSSQLDEIQTEAINVLREKRALENLRNLATHPYRAEEFSAVLQAYNQLPGATPIAVDLAMNETERIKSLIETRLADLDARQQSLSDDALKIQADITEMQIEENQLRSLHDSVQQLYIDVLYQEILDRLLQIRFSGLSAESAIENVPMSNSLAITGAGIIGGFFAATLVIIRTWWEQTRIKQYPYE